MHLLQRLQETFLNLLERVRLAHWIEIITAHPRCTYYFGPFSTEDEAKLANAGFIDDLLQERAEIIAVTIKRCQPTQLTLVEEELVETT
jgi:hypothetical protein